MYTKSRQALIDRVDGPLHVPVKAGGAPVHPGGWTVANGIDYNIWYAKQLEAYCKHLYPEEWAK